MFANTTSPSKNYAFAWRTAQGLPSGRDTPNDVENVLIRVTDGAVLATLGGTYWETGEMRANRYELLAAWSPDSRAVIEVANSRWDSDSFAYYRIDGATATKLDLRALVEPVMTARLPPRNRQGNSFRVHEDLPVTLDARGTPALYRDALCAQGRNQQRLQGAGQHQGERRQAVRAGRVGAAGERELDQSCR